MAVGPRAMKSRAYYAYVALAVLAGCENGAVDQGSPSNEPGIVGASQDVPPEAPPGTCWDKITGASVTGTVTKQVLVKPADLTADGQIENPAVYRNETRQTIVREGDKTWFETPCPDVFTEEFVTSLQRALAARKLYDAPISGMMSAATRTAVRKYQEPLGLSSEILSITAARSLGLIPYGVDGA